MTDQEMWDSYLAFATAQKQAVVTPSIISGIVGRSLTYLVDKLVILWGKHKATLIPALSQLAIAALEALVANKAAIDLVNKPGPT